jgi:mevalonate pyrophosphate decarboxylase
MLKMCITVEDIQAWEVRITVETLRAASARANSNIAFIKYWGNADDHLRLPANPSMSINLDGLHTDTTVIWDDQLEGDELTINKLPAESKALNRVSAHLDYIRPQLPPPELTFLSENLQPLHA